MYLWGILAGMLAVIMETTFRTHNSYTSMLWLYLPGAICINYCIFRLARTANHFLDITIIFAFCTLGMRILSSLFVLNEPVTKSTCVAIALLFAAQIVRYMWR